MTTRGKIKIAALILMIFGVFGAAVVLSGLKYIHSPFLETIYLYCKFAVLVVYDFIVYILRELWGLVFKSWITVWAMLGILLVIILRWLFNYHSE